jgi:F-type H+-transporting ATPase subunit b
MGEIAQTFGVDWPHLAAQVISFSIVCLVLYRLAYRPVLAMLATRREQIAQGIANTEKIDAALAAIDATREQVLEAARVESSRLIDAAREVAARLHEDEVRRASLAAERVVARAHERTDREHAEMLASLRREVGRLVVQTTAAVAGRVLTPDDQRRLVQDATRELKAA